MRGVDWGVKGKERWENGGLIVVAEGLGMRC